MTGGISLFHSALRVPRSPFPMSDDDALRAAIVAAPDADLPRLVYADFIQENGDEAGAEFIRAQIELANTPEYEPFAVFCHTHRPDWVTGDDRRDTLPNAVGVDWVPGHLFRRGFGWSVQSAFLPALQRGVPQLRAREPVQSLALVNAGLPEQWEEFARSPWLPDIRSVWFAGLATPTEPVRVLCAAPAATGLRELKFIRGDSPAMAVLLDGIFASPLGRGLTALSLRHSTEESGELIEAMAGATALADLTLARLSQPWQAVQVLARSELLGRLRTLRLSGSYISAGNVTELVEPAAVGGLTILDLSETYLRDSAAEVLASSPNLTGLRKLNLNDNSLGSDGVQRLARSQALGGLRSLLLRQTGTDNAAVRRLTRAPFWATLVELDLTRNPVDDRGAGYLLSAETPPDLTALRLSVNRFAEPLREALVEKYGPAVRFVPDGH
jgi:uncharacterized protein (TIGR02996 family)